MTTLPTGINAMSIPPFSAYMTVEHPPTAPYSRPTPAPCETSSQPHLNRLWPASSHAPVYFNKPYHHLIWTEGTLEEEGSWPLKDQKARRKRDSLAEALPDSSVTKNYPVEAWSNPSPSHPLHFSWTEPYTAFPWETTTVGHAWKP